MKKQVLSILIIVFTSLMLSSCNITKKYIQPESTTVDKAKIETSSIIEDNSSFEEFTTTVSARKLTNKANLFSDENNNVIVIDQSIAVEKCIILNENETIIIGQDCELIINNGISIEGTLFISSGGKIIVEGGSFEIKGNIISEGNINIGQNARLNVYSNGNVFISNRGAFQCETENISIDNGVISCLGEKSIKYCSEELKSNFADEISQAIYTVIDTKGNILESNEITDKEIYSKLNTVYNINNNVPQNGLIEILEISFDNGNIVKIKFMYERISEINNVKISDILNLSEQSGVSIMASSYPEIFHNNKVYYYNGTHSNQKIINGKVIHDSNEINIEDVKENGKYLGESIMDYNYKSSPSKELNVTNSYIPYEVYEMSDDSIVLIATEPTHDNTYCHYVLK